jgi:hypothetical protein
MPTPRDSIRQKFFDQKPKSIEITLDDGVKIDVRQTMLGDMLDAVSAAEQKQRMANLLIMSCFVPGTEERVFTPEDFEILMKVPSGGYYRHLQDAINSFLPSAEIEVAKKPTAEAASNGVST